MRSVGIGVVMRSGVVVGLANDADSCGILVHPLARIGAGQRLRSGV